MRSALRSSASLLRRGGISTKNFDKSLLYLAPLAPQLWGEPEFQSPPELGDLGGKKVSDVNQRTCVYTVAFLRGAGGISRFENRL
jgi:hypothetical protein